MRHFSGLTFALILTCGSIVGRAEDRLPSMGAAQAVMPVLDGGVAFPNAGAYSVQGGGVDPDASAVFGREIPIDDPAGRALEKFHASLRRTEQGQGKTRLVFFGASHVASDLFTGFIRDELQRRFGDGGPGFVVPIRPWKTYRHHRFAFGGSWRRWKTMRVYADAPRRDLYGLAGLAVETNRANADGFMVSSENSSLPSHVSHFELYFLRQPLGGDMAIWIDGRQVQHISTRAERVGPGYAQWDVPDGPHRFEVRALGNGRVRVFGVSAERAQPGVIVDTLGINGAQATFQLQWDDGLFREHLTKIDPSLVVLAYGTNESASDQPLSQYEVELRRVVARVRETVPNSSCLLVGPSDRPIRMGRNSNVWEPRTRTMDLIGVQRRVAAEYGCGYFDIVAFQGGPLSMLDWCNATPPYGARDHVHFTSLGYRRLGEVLLRALLDGYP